MRQAGRASAWRRLRGDLVTLLAVAIAVSCLSISSASEVELPTHAPRPGGVATVALPAHPAATLRPPQILHAGKRVPVVMQGGQWHAIIGIPLSATPGTLTLERIEPQPAMDLPVAIEPHAYREQRLDVARRYVEPNTEQLTRIRSERSLLDTALERFSEPGPPTYRFAAPVPGRRSPSFGFRRIFNDQPRSPHSGMDIRANSGTPVRAPLAGTVALTGEFYFNGNTVLLDHGQGFVTAYLHLDTIDVAQDQVVQAGEQLGTVGATGRVTGAHLHFGTYLNGAAVDPALFMTDDAVASASSDQAERD